MTEKATSRVNKTVTNAGFIESLQNALFSNNLLAIHLEGGTDKCLYIGIDSVQQEDGSGNGFNVHGVVMLSNEYKQYSKVSGYLKYYDRSKPGTGSVTIEET